MSLEKDRIFFRNYSIVIGLLLVTIIVFLLAAVSLGTNDAVLAERQSDAVSELTAPVGQIKTPRAQDTAATQTAATGGEGSSVNGQQVYRGICASCHGTGLPSVPQLGDAGDWQQRLDAKGMDTLYNHAINGFMGESGMPMPAKGGNPSLTDAEVRAAVDYMVSSSQ